jgi:antitoxin component HigA of HigAB toxin-antitoxin module
MTEADYRDKMAELERLIVLDPDPVSEEGQRLQKLAEECEEYEKEHFRL